MRLLLARAAIGVLWRAQLDALTPESSPSLDELIVGEIVIVEPLATGEIMVWLRRWALDEDPAMRGKKNATGLLRAVADLPPSRVLTDWYVHHRPILETSGDWPAVADSLSDRGSVARGRDGEGKETERETSQKGTLAQSESPDSAREAAGPDGPPRSRSGQPATVTTSPEAEGPGRADGAATPPEAAGTTAIEDDAGAGSQVRATAADKATYPDWRSILRETGGTMPMGTANREKARLENLKLARMATEREHKAEAEAAEEEVAA